jgi:hypothetical protein
MIAAFLLASAVATATAAPAASGVPAREIVYKVSTLLRLDDITETFGGGIDASPPASQDSVEDHGTVVVDIMGKLADGDLIVRMSGQWAQRLRAVPINALVTPNGTVELDPSVLDDVALELLPYFAIGFAPVGPLDTSTHWTVELLGEKTSIETQYAITAVKGSMVTIHKTQTIKALGSETVDGTVVYDVKLMAPLSGEVKKRLTQTRPNGETTGSFNIRFDLVSDTFQKVKP